MPSTIHHALVLNLHQPAGNLDAMLNSDIEQERWHGKECLFCYDRIPRAVWGWEDVARVHCAMSGSLLESLADPDFQARTYGIVKCGDVLWNLRNPALDILGTGYYHPVMPLIPAADREEHVQRWLGLARHLFARGGFSGFWPPECGFSMEMIPILQRAGFRYVIVDSEHIAPMTPMRWEEIRYRPHIAKFGDSEIVVIPRDRDLSIAQEGGMEVGWFLHELNERCKWCDFEPLVCTVTDGENGGWFRNIRMESNYWGAFYHPFLRQVRAGETNVRPTFIHDYLDRHGAHGQVIVKTGAWNTGEHHGVGFVQWTGSQMQRDAWARLAEVSRAVHAARAQAWSPSGNDEQRRCLDEAWWRLLRAETSCHYFWGEAWVNRAHEGLNETLHWVEQARRCASN